MDDLPCSCKLILLRRMINVAKNELTQIFSKWLNCLLFLIEPEISINMLSMILGLKHGLKVIKINGFVS